MAMLYDTDFMLWSEEQASLLRRLADGERVNNALDWDHLIDEVADLGRSQLHAVESLLGVGLCHLMFVAAASRHAAVPHWRGEAVAALRQARKRFTPGMASRIDFADVWNDARSTAIEKLAGVSGVCWDPPVMAPFDLAFMLNHAADIDALLEGLRNAAD